MADSQVVSTPTAGRGGGPGGPGGPGGTGGLGGTGGRLLSLDVYRGLVMTLLIAEGAGVYEALHGLDAPWAKAVAGQFMHAPWDGLTFWDLVQPAFMFIVGVAMVFSMRKRRGRGDRWAKRFGHILRRCAILFLLGTGLHCLYADKLVFELWNVLTQLSVTILIAFLIMELPAAAQLLISLALIGGTDLAYRFIHVAPYDQTFVPGANFGSYMDMLLMGGLNSDHWVAINWFPTAAHTIWGVLAGRVLIGPGGAGRKAVTLALWGAAGIVVGYGLDFAGYAPIIKRICTGPFVIVTGGWCLLALAVFYGLIDIKGWRRGGTFFIIVGMNSIFIYMVSEALAFTWLNPKTYIFVGGVLEWFGVQEPYSRLVNALAVWAILWSMCYWLYKNKVFIRI
jgi:predicted acyltransferase